MNKSTKKLIQEVEKMELREATENIKLETSYCTKCSYTNYRNIGTYICAKCGKNK